MGCPKCGYKLKSITHPPSHKEDAEYYTVGCDRCWWEMPYVYTKKKPADKTTENLNKGW